MNISSLGTSAYSAADFSAMRKQPFQKTDADANGTVSRDELSKAVSKAPKPAGAPEMDTDKLFKSLDADSDGQITESEMETGMEKMAANRPEGGQAGAPSGAPPAGGPPPGGGMPPSGGAGAGAASGTEASDNETYDVRDTNEDGEVSMEEQLAYDLSQAAAAEAEAAKQTASKATDKSGANGEVKTGVYLDTQA